MDRVDLLVDLGGSEECVYLWRQYLRRSSFQQLVRAQVGATSTVAVHSRKELGVTCLPLTLLSSLEVHLVVIMLLAEHVREPESPWSCRVMD